jgi:predicted GNAT superfamily acetyltransferase
LLKPIVPERSAVEHDGLVIESHWPEEKLRAMFRDILRAMAYSNWLISGEQGGEGRAIG